MILVADSGSTKCDWLLIGHGEQKIAKTMGFNPFFHSEELIFDELTKNADLSAHKLEIEAVYFYGAGCSSEQRNMIVHKALAAFFSNASTILVDHDLTGAAVATCGSDPGIACIIGTGSNSCYFDGKKTHEEVPALGYILGDEGSGAYFGKILLANFCYKLLPKELMEELVAEYGITKEIVFANVYNKANPNVYLASFMRFVSAHREHPYVKEMIYNGLKAFAEIHIKCYDNYREVPVHFVGSIAYYFREPLNRVANDLGFTVGNIVKKPIEPIGAFHQMSYGSL